MSESLHQRIVSAIGNQYDVQAEIGRGGMSVVYRARDIRLNRLIAIKVLPPELAYDPAIRTRFTREAQTSAQLSHPHIVPIYDVGYRDGIAYFVMALITGGNLEALLAREPRQPLEQARRILCEVADALEYAHLRGVVHRDIKPDNILIDRDSGRAMVTDFGIARAIEAGSRLTITGNAVGTPTYMSPEQAVGEREVDGRCDIYSLGVVGYQMLTGRLPFTAANSMALLMKHVSERPRPIEELRPDAPPPLRNTIERALMKSPDDRWPTAAAMRDALRSDNVPAPAWRAEREPVRYTSPRPETRRRRTSRESASGEATTTSPSEATPGLRERGGVPQPNALSTALEPEHLASLTPEQRTDLRVWNGRINLLDRVKTARNYLLATTVATGMGLAGFVSAMVEPDLFPLLFAPIVPAFMWRKLWQRGKSLRKSGLRLRRVFLLPRARWALASPSADPVEKEIAKLAPREVLGGTYGSAVRRAAVDRSAILEIVKSLSKADRALLPDIEPTVNGLVERVSHLAQALHKLDYEFHPRLAAEFDERLSELEREPMTADNERHFALLERQRQTLDELAQRRAALARQLEGAGLALGNLRLDLIKFRSSGLESALSDVSTATQEARALSREIAMALDVAAEVNRI